MQRVRGYQEPTKAPPPRYHHADTDQGRPLVNTLHLRELDQLDGLSPEPVRVNCVACETFLYLCRTARTSVHVSSVYEANSHPSDRISNSRDGSKRSVLNANSRLGCMQMTSGVTK